MDGSCVYWSCRRKFMLRMGEYIMAKTFIDDWKILPRFMMLVFTFMSFRVVEWFMGLDDPTTQQAGLVSVVMGAATGAFAVWMGKEAK